MHYTEIAIPKPFEGAPKINMPDIFGASPNKPVILRIAVTGERPITYGVRDLPNGLTMKDGIITGEIKEPGEYTVILTAQNILGKAEKKLVLEIEDNHVLLTPLLGFTSWNAFGPTVSQEKMEKTAQKMIETGICEYGYSYINTDSGWQEKYGGKYDAVMPNSKFPDMKKMCDKIHSYGLKSGIYSTPMLTAWGCPEEFESIPGCTQGEPDILFSDMMGGIGKIRKEKNNVEQWTEWGFDYLKYDWSPCDPYNAELMRKELIASSRDFGYCVTVHAKEYYVNYWSKYCNSYRNNTDAGGHWENFLLLYNSYKPFVKSMNKGHFYDLDMLDMGTCHFFENGCQYTEDEQIVAYSIRAFFGSPIQISSDLEYLSDFEMAVYCNEEVIAINQDVAFDSNKPFLKEEDEGKFVHAYKRNLSDGTYAIMILNLGNSTENVQIPLDEESLIRDVWAKKDIAKTNTIDIHMESHTVRIFKISAL